MRDLKFRCWDKENKVMKTSKYWKIGFDGELWPQNLFEWKDGQFEIMQFTGLKDKNGKEIYEGDIVKNKLGERLVQWRVNSTFCGWSITKSNSSYYHWEIIGNIYENPEILK